jgi:hypothetical protein
VIAAATVVCAIPILGWIECAVLGVAALIVFIAGVIAALNNKGDSERRRIARASARLWATVEEDGCAMTIG